MLNQEALDQIRQDLDTFYKEEFEKYVLRSH